MESLLTRGAVGDILEGSRPQDPVFQILGTKPMGQDQFPNGNSDPKYRLMISDGLNSHQYCIISNQDLVRDIKAGHLEKFTIIKLKAYNIVEAADSLGFNKRIIYIMNLEIVKPGRDVGVKLGNPVAKVETKKTETSVCGDENQHKNQSDYNEQFNNRNMHNNYHDTSYDQQENFDRSSAARGMNNRFGNGFNENHTQIQPYPNTGPVMAESNDMMKPQQPSRREDFDMTCIDINSLTPYIGKWTIKGRVLSKSGKRTWSNAKGEGKLFSFEIADKTGHLKVTAFQNECDKFFDYIQPNEVYYISRAQLKNANKAYTNADYEVTLQQESIVQKCIDQREISDMPQQRYNFVTISSLPTLPVNQIVDLMGVIESVGDCQTIMAKAKNKELKKRNLTIVDMSRHTISLCIWGEQGEDFKGQQGDIIVSKGARLSDYGGRTASAGDSILINPDIPETRKLKTWHSNLIDSNFTHLSASQDSGVYNDQWKTLDKLMDIEAARSGNTVVGKVKASIIMVGRNPVYKACPTEGCGKKLVDTVTNEMKCEKCQQTFTHCKYRFKTDVKITDATGTVWITLWDEKAEALLGYKAEEMQRHMVSDDKELYEKIIQTPYFKNFIFVLKPRLDTYNNEERLKCSCIKLEAVNTVVYGNYLVEQIKAMSAGIAVN